MARVALALEGGERSRGERGGAGNAALLVVDDRRRCVEANETACAVLGRSRAELVGRPLDQLVDSSMATRIAHFWRAVGDRGGHAGPIAAPDGTELEIEVRRNVATGRHLVTLSPARPARRRRFASDPRPAGPNPAPAGRFAGRTPSARECEILRLLATGATDPQIAALLGLSPATVQTHVRNAKAKLGARTRAQAVAMAIGRGLIPLPSAE